MLILIKFVTVMEVYKEIVSLLEEMSPISLDDMSSIRLMKRTDTKFLTNLPTLLKLLKLAQKNYFVQEVNGHRVANYATTYWDDALHHQFYRIHQCGHRPRTKVRVRSYSDSELAFLEVKKKNNHGKTSKKRIHVPSVDAVVNERYGEDFLQNLTGHTFDEIIPTLSNRFKRITLVNHGKTERLTIDFDLSFLNRENGVEQAMENIVIIELKRDGRLPSPIMPILRELRIKPAGFSKYCVGLSVTDNTLRKNLFKERLVYIRKIAERNCLPH